MATTPEYDPVLIRFRRALDAMYGIVSTASCCSARVREERHAPIPTYDIAVFLRDLPDRWIEAGSALRAFTSISLMQTHSWILS